ncbi:hypothetical protein [Aurantiacibacter spongiae]|uniref:Uncharacterized protein n=1 Tax=Aurantiacibacter spongiae TaxID=2488860 RepID=A0A3N5DMQ7_9SPHN|nr:hypothetical protein [Aurantiacibacter spongiae]RPF72175.1 hypothetical protein EG799_11505 [Aurantiacibacter spongiae]
MRAFFVTFISVIVILLPGREANRVAGLKGAGLASAALWFAVMLSATGGAALAAWAGHLLAPSAPAPLTSLLLAAAFVLGGAELLAGVTGDAAGLAIAANAMLHDDALLAGFGGAAGASAALGIAAMAGPDWERIPRPRIARSVGFALMAGGGVTAFLTL